MSQQKAQQAFLSVSTAEAAADNISGITAANPGVVTANAHGIANGAIVRIASVLGMLQVNNRAFVVANQTTNTFELKGVDTTDYTAYASGGQAFAQTMAEVGYMREGGGMDGEAPDVDVSHLRSLEREFLLGLPDPGNFQLQLWLPSTADTGQARLRKLKELGTAAAFSLTLASGQVMAFMGLVKSFALQPITMDTAVGAAVAIRLRSAVSWFA
jgi:hypothetical protein